MAGSDAKATPSRRDTSRGPSAESRKSEGLDRIISENHLDNHSNYHGHGYNPKAEALEDDDNSIDGTDLAEKESGDATDLEQGSSDDITTEVRDGIENKRDLEVGEQLEKTRTSKSAKSARSIRDPNLVAWDGPHDKQNPRNWSLKRKWAATFVGEDLPIFTPN
jgi:hypothetical protein